MLISECVNILERMSTQLWVASTLGTYSILSILFFFFFFLMEWGFDGVGV
jgi:hypothetical protein